MRRSKAIAQHAEDAGALFKRPIRRSFANLLPRIRVQNAIPRWIMRDGQGRPMAVVRTPSGLALFAPGLESGPE